MISSIPLLQSALNFFLKRILVHYSCSQIFELFHLHKGAIINLYIVTSSCILISRYDHVFSFISMCIFLLPRCLTSICDAVVLKKCVSRFLQLTGIINRTQYKNTPAWKYITLWHYLLYYMNAQLGQLENRINPEWHQWKWNLWGDRQNTHGKITKQWRFFQNLKLTQL